MVVYWLVLGDSSACIHEPRLAKHPCPLTLTTLPLRFPPTPRSTLQYRLHDIEDLKGFGKSHKACPYYTARKWADVR